MSGKRLVSVMLLVLLLCSVFVTAVQADEVLKAAVPNVTSVKCDRDKAVIGSKVTLTVKTSVKAASLSVKINDEKATTYTKKSKNTTVTDNGKTWKIVFKTATAGKNTITVTAANSAKKSGKAKKGSIFVVSKDYKPALAAPKGFSAKLKNGNEVLLSWKTVSGASGYRIFMAKGDGSFKKIADVAAEKGTKTYKYTKKGLVWETSYSFKICPYEKVDSTKFISAKTSGVKKITTSEELSDVVSVEADYTKVFKWEKVTLTVKTNAKASAITVSDNGTALSRYDFTSTCIDNKGKIWTVVITCEDEGKHTYAITAENAQGIRGKAMTSVINVYPSYGYQPQYAAPDNFKWQQLGDGQVSLSWDAVEGAEGYAILLDDRDNQMIAAIPANGASSYQTTIDGLEANTEIDLSVCGYEVIKDKKVCSANHSQLIFSLDNAQTWSYITMDDGTLKLTGYNGHNKSVVIPAEMAGKKVSTIGEEAFSGCSFTNVVISEGITGIRNGAFRSCSNLSTITIPDSVTFLGENMFSFCSKLSSVKLPSHIDKLPDSMFYSCSSLDQITIPSSVTIIGDDVFIGCSSLSSIDIPGNVVSIGAFVFYQCDALTSVIVPNSVKGLGQNVFWDCDMLKSVTLSNSLLEIPYGTFSDCHSLSSVSIPSGISKIGYHAFSNCYSLYELFIPNSVSNISGNAFDGDLDLKIKCHAGSYAEQFANTNAIPVIYAY